MEIRKGNIIIKTTAGYTDSDNCLPTLEIIETASGQTICKLKITATGHAAGYEWAERIDFEEVPVELFV